MTKHFYLLASLLFTTDSPLCNAMENTIGNSTPNIINIITATNTPRSVICFPSNTIAISGNDGCCLYNFSTNKKLKEWRVDSKNPHFIRIAAHPNKQLLALLNNNTLIIYDIRKKKKIWEKSSKDFKSIPVFSSIDDTILIGNKIRDVYSFNYKDKSHTPKKYVLPSMPYDMNLRYHPTKPECTVTPDKNNKLNILQFGKDPLIKKSVFINQQVVGCKYSHDGSMIAIHQSNRCSILNPQSEWKNSIDTDNSQHVYGMAFHPTSLILATLHFSLTSPNGIICYLHAKNDRLIASTTLSLSDNESCHNDGIHDERLAFSDDATKIFVALHDKCLELEVPFDVLLDKLYQPGTEYRCISIICALKRYIYNDKLPQDVRYLLIQYLLTISKF